MIHTRLVVVRLAVAATTLALSLGFFSGIGLAHGAAVQVTPSQAGPGATITITGTGFEAGKAVVITLESALAQTALGTVNVDESESFTFTAVIPSSTGAGSYTVMASNAAAGGDDETSGDLMVTAPPPAQVNPAQPETNPQPAAQPAIVHERTTAEDVVVGVIFVGLALIGLTLIFASRVHGSRRVPQA